MVNKFKKGQRVWWNGPEGETSEFHTIVSDVQRNMKKLLSNGKSTDDIHYGMIIWIRNQSGEKIRAYSHELEPVYTGSYEALSARYQSVQTDLESYIRQKLRANGGRIAIDISDEAKQECECDSDIYPVISTLFGKHGDNPNIGITDVYLKDSTIYADGTDTITGSDEIGFAISYEQYSDIAYFINVVLNLKN